MNGGAPTFEQRLAAALEGQRPTDGAPATLRSRVLEIPTARTPFPFDRHGAWRLAGTAVAAVIVVSVLGLRLGAVGPQVVTPGASGGGIDPTVEGPEIITALIRTLPLVGWSAAAILAVVGLRLLLRSPRDRRRLAAAAVIGLAAIGSAGLASHPGPGVGGWNGYGPSFGFRLVETPNVTDGDGLPLATLVESAEPGQPFAFFFVVHNPGPLPVRLEGLIEDEGARDRIAPRWTALAIARDVNMIGGPLSNATPFQPVDIPPDGDIGLYVIGKASACAIGAAPSASSQAYAGRGPDIQLVYSVFGLTNTSTYHMPVMIEEPILEGCSG